MKDLDKGTAPDLSWLKASQAALAQLDEVMPFLVSKLESGLYSSLSPPHHQSNQNIGRLLF